MNTRGDRGERDGTVQDAERVQHLRAAGETMRQGMAKLAQRLVFEDEPARFEQALARLAADGVEDDIRD